MIGPVISTEEMIVAKVLMSSSPDDMTLTMQDAVTRRVQRRQTSIVIDPAAAASALTSPASMSFEACLSPIREQTRLPLIPEQLRPSPIRDQMQKSPIEE